MHRSRWALTVACCAFGSAMVSGCDGLLDVENVTAIEATDLRNAESVEIWVNGSRASVQAAWDRVLLLLSWPSDEWTWVGPHGWWDALNAGHIDSPDNIGLRDVYGVIAATQWFTNETIEVLDSLDQVGELADRTLLSQAYLYGAIVHSSIADAFEDYAPSDLNEPGPAIGPGNMSSFYDIAVEYATEGLALAPAGVLRRDLFAIRARAHQARQVWARIRPPPADVSGGGLVSSSEAVSDALAALGQDDGDWRMEFAFEPFVVPTSRTVGEMNCIVNASSGARYALPSGGASGLGVQADSVVLLDPIDGTPDPSVVRSIDEVFLVDGDCGSSTLTVTSAREMRLIIAEDALVGGDTGTFETHVNVARAAEGLTDWTATSGVAARDMLIYERQSRLFMTGRRLLDMYRFGISGDTWDPASIAATAPGTLYPIAQTEIDVNCFLNGTCGG